MKKTFILLSLLILSFNGFLLAEKSDTLVNIKKNTISTDLTPLIKTYLNFGEYYYHPANYEYDPYILMYRRFINPKNALRVGVGFDSHSSKGIKDDTLETTNSRSQINFGIGYERQIILGKRSLLFWGIDLTYANGTNTSKYSYSTFNYYEDKDLSNKYGVIPFIGYCFSLTKRLSISTEGNLLFYYTKNISERQFYPDGANNQKAESNQTTYSYNPPTSIQIRFNF